MCVVLASEGYPEKPKIGYAIEGIEANLWRCRFRGDFGGMLSGRGSVHPSIFGS